MINSGTTALTTTGQQTITVLISTSRYRKIVLINEGTTAGFFSIDGSTPSCRMPAAASPTSPIVISIDNPSGTVNLQVSGNGLSGIWAWAV